MIDNASHSKIIAFSVRKTIIQEKKIEWMEISIQWQTFSFRRGRQGELSKTIHTFLVAAI